MIRIYIILFFIICVTLIISEKHELEAKSSELLNNILGNHESKYRLPTTTIPKIYVLEFEPDMLAQEFTFTGKGKIHLQILQLTSEIVIHKSATLQVKENSVSIVNTNGETIKAEKFKWYTKNEFYKIIFSRKLRPGFYTLNIEWKGIDGATDAWIPIDGFYRTEDSVSEFKYMVTTHFEPDGARGAFPCFDEPGLKAQFEISIKHFPNYTAISNMPVASIKNSTNDKVITRFERSIKMSPYIPCWAVAHYDKIENSDGNITFYTIPDQLELVRYALEASEKVILVMNEYTQVPYALSKLDQITIPSYKPIAMEHWGLVSYLTSYVQFKNTSIIPNLIMQDQITNIVAHELAHQWFGNLVTCMWWDDLFLNEAFADYFEYKIVDMMYPEWNFMDVFAVKSINEDVFVLTDELRPVKWMPQTKMEMEEIFGQVTYAQGGAIVYMLEHLMGAEVFRDGLKHYLYRNQYAAVVADDLWISLQTAYDNAFPYKKWNIKETIEPWLEQVGYPIVTVKRDYQKGIVKLTQNNVNKKFYDCKWRIPITYATKSNPSFSLQTPIIWMEPNETLIIPNIKNSDWIILNTQQKGLYQVRYDTENWGKIIRYLNSNNFENIHPINRAQLIYDAKSMSKEDSTHLSILINLTSYLHQETNSLPWIPAESLILKFGNMMQNTPEEKTFEMYVKFLLNRIMKEVKYTYEPNDKFDKSRVRYMLAPYACKYHHDQCHSDAFRLLNKYLENPSDNAFPDNDWPWILCYGLRHANKSVWDYFLSENIPLPQKISDSKFMFFKCANTTKSKKQYLSSVIAKNSTLSARNVHDTIKSFLDGSHENVDIAMNYVIENFDQIEKFFEDKDDGDTMQHVIINVCLSTKCQNQYDKWKAFLEPRMSRLKEKYDNKVLDNAYNNMENIIEQSKKLSRKFHNLMDDILNFNGIK